MRIYELNPALWSPIGLDRISELVAKARLPGINEHHPEYNLYGADEVRSIVG